MEVDWSRFPHLDEEMRSGLMRMAQALGNEVAADVLRLDRPDQMAPRIRAFLEFENRLVANAAHHAEQSSQLSAALGAARHELHALSAAREAVEHTRSVLQSEAQQMAAARHSASNSSSGQRPLKLEVPRYEGNEGENLSHWIIAVEKAGEAALIRDESLHVAFAISHMRGKAHAWVYALLEADRNAFPTWSSLVEGLRRTFQYPNNDFHLHTRFLECKQGRRTLHEYIQELRHLCASITSSQLTEELKVNVFMKGLSQGVARTQLFRVIPSSMEEAFRVATIEEHAQKAAQRGNAVAVPRPDPTAVAANSSAAPMDLTAVERSKSGACHNCGRMGHFARECRQPKGGRGLARRGRGTAGRGSQGAAVTPRGSAHQGNARLQ